MPSPAPSHCAHTAVEFVTEIVKNPESDDSRFPILVRVDVLCKGCGHKFPLLRTATTEIVPGPATPKKPIVNIHT